LPGKPYSVPEKQSAPEYLFAIYQILKKEFETDIGDVCRTPLSLSRIGRSYRSVAAFQVVSQLGAKSWSGLGLPMKFYFLILGSALILGSLWLLVSRLILVRKAKHGIGKVERIRRMDYFPDDDGGPSKHIEVTYIDEGGNQKAFIVDNSLLAYTHRPGQSIPLAILGDKVLVNTPLNLAAAPLGLFVLGAVTAAVYVLAY
jgi:hypothetical protein